MDTADQRKHAKNFLKKVEEYLAYGGRLVPSCTPGTRAGEAR